MSAVHQSGQLVRAGEFFLPFLWLIPNQLFIIDFSNQSLGILSPVYPDGH